MKWDFHRKMRLTLRQRWDWRRIRDETEKEMRQGLRQWWDTLRQELRKPTCSCISPHCNINLKSTLLDGTSTETEMRDTDVRQRWHSDRNGAEMRWNWERDGTGTEISEMNDTSQQPRENHPPSVCYLTVTVTNIHLNPHVLLQIPSPHSLTCQLFYL